jgi:hypothetical protein
MGFEFIFGIPVAIFVAYAIIFGLFITLESLEDRMAKQIKESGHFPRLQKFFRDTQRDQTQVH